jgi:orotate phosphoribosyltransferase
MFRASLRAGTMTVARGGSAGGCADSASSDVERAIRSEAIIGVTIHGIVAATAIAVEWFMTGMHESYSYHGPERTRGAPVKVRLSRTSIAG